MTLARTRSESEQLYSALRTLSVTGLPVLIGEGGSGEDFVRQIARLPNVHLCHLPPKAKPTLVNQLRTAFDQARELKPDYVLYTEPDKGSFFRHGLGKLAEAARSPNSADLGLVVAARTGRGLNTYPEGQRVAEGFMNRIASEALGRPGDYTYGPLLIQRRLLPYTHLFPENLGWGWRFFLMALARQLQLRIDLCPVGGQCPRAQREEDDHFARDYRLRQLIENVTGLANGWTCLLDPDLEPAPLVEAA